MSPEERQLLAGMFERIKANSAAPRDQEAEAFINDQIKAQPSAPYLLAQTVIVQDFALQAANQKLQQLEARVHELESAPKPSTSFLGGLLGEPARRRLRPRPAPPPALSVSRRVARGAPRRLRRRPAIRRNRAATPSQASRRRALQASAQRRRAAF